MDKRIKNLVNKTIKGEMYVEPIKTPFQREDLFLSPVKMSSKRVCEYIRKQEPMITEDSCFTGLLKFDDSVEGTFLTEADIKTFISPLQIFTISLLIILLHLNGSTRQAILKK